MSQKRWLTAISIAVLTLGTSACSGGQSEQSTVSSGCGSGEAVTVNLTNSTQPVSLDGNYDTIIPFQQINRNLYDGLFQLDDDMEVQPSLATDYSQPDDVTYNITLRDDVVFHDGSPFTAADVVSTFDRIENDEDLASRQRTYVSNVESVTELGEHEVQFTLKQPNAAFIKTLASTIYITPESVIDEVGSVEFGQKPVGSGPFIFDSWTKGDNVVLKANCDYWGDKPIPSRVEFRFISEPATQISSLQSGEIDIATGVTPDLAAALENSGDVSVQSVDGNNSLWLSLNTLEGPFSDERVRQALNYAIDKEAITEQLMGGFATPVGQIYGASIFGYSEGVDPYPYDPERARSLLEEAGYGDGELEIDFVLYYDYLNAVHQAIASDLTDVGIDVTSRTDPNYFADTWLQEEMAPNQAFIASNTNILMDADYPLGLWFDGERRGLYFHTPETDAAIAEARGIWDPDQRQAAYDALNADLHEIAPVSFLFSTDAIYGTSNRIDWKPRPDGAIYLAGVTKTR